MKWHSKKNLNDLVKTSEALLKKSVSRVDLETGLSEASKPETNEEALIRFAKLLSEERRLRLAKSPHGQSSNWK